MKKLVLVLFVFCFAIVPLQTQAGMTDLGALGGYNNNSYAYGINDSGQIVGYSRTASGDHAFIYDNGMIDLGIDGGALGINNSGQIVGCFYDEYTRAFIYDYNNNTMTDLGPLLNPYGDDYSVAYGINDSGQVTGHYMSLNRDRAFSYYDGAITDLGTLGGNHSYTFGGINNLGQIVGWSHTASYKFRAFFKQNNSPMGNLGTLPGGDYSIARAINDSGQIVGGSDNASGQSRAFLYNNGAMTDLGTLGGSNSNACGINNLGQIVGESKTASGETHAFYYFANEMFDLGTLGGTYSSAKAINNSGQIIGSSKTASGQTHAFVYEPVSCTTDNPNPYITDTECVAPCADEPVTNFGSRYAKCIDGRCMYRDYASTSGPSDTWTHYYCYDLE